MSTLETMSIDQLRAQCDEAVQDDSDGLDPDEVFGRLEEKYTALVKSEQLG